MALKHSIKFKNIFGDDIEKDLFFNITKAELTELNFKYEDDGGFDGRVKRLGASGTNGKLIMDTLKDILGKAYGERQGDALVKGDVVREKFYASEEYSKVFEDLVKGDLNPYEFISAMLPADNDIQDPAGKTPSQLARERSEANMQGHQQKQVSQPEPQTVELATAEPVLEKQPETPVKSEAELFAEWKASQGLS